MAKPERYQTALHRALGLAVVIRVYLWTAPALIMAYLGWMIYLGNNHPDKLQENLTFGVAVSALLLAMFAFGAISIQLQVMLYQMQQAQEHIIVDGINAEHLTKAIETFTTELRRRAQPAPIQMNLALRNMRKERG